MVTNACNPRIEGAGDGQILGAHAVGLKPELNTIFILVANIPLDIIKGGKIISTYEL